MSVRGASPWVLRATDASPTRMRILCLPHAGSGAASFAAWAERLGHGIDIVPLQPPGREGRLNEAPFTDMDSLVASLFAAAAPLCEGRYAVFGHSMGAHVAFELVCRLRDEGRELPSCLIVSGARAPHLPATRPLLFELGDEDLLNAIEIRYGARFEPEMREIVRLSMPTLRADLRVIETRPLRPTPPLPVPLLALAGASDASVPLADARQWQRHTSDDFEFKVIPGGHFFPSTQREMLLACVARSLSQHSAADA